jgi:hypothetical protein
MDELPMTSEDDCIICGKWPEKDRWALREMIDSLPLDDEYMRRIVEQPEQTFGPPGIPARELTPPGGGQKTVAGAHEVVLSER